MGTVLASRPCSVAAGARLARRNRHMTIQMRCAITSRVQVHGDGNGWYGASIFIRPTAHRGQLVVNLVQSGEDSPSREPWSGRPVFACRPRHLGDRPIASRPSPAPFVTVR